MSNLDLMIYPVTFKRVIVNHCGQNEPFHFLDDVSKMLCVLRKF